VNERPPTAGEWIAARSLTPDEFMLHGLVATCGWNVASGVLLWAAVQEPSISPSLAVLVLASSNALLLTVLIVVGWKRDSRPSSIGSETQQALHDGRGSTDERDAGHAEARGVRAHPPGEQLSDRETKRQHEKDERHGGERQAGQAFGCQ
jgi:hypothetical protein